MSPEIAIRTCTAADVPPFLETFGSAFGFTFDAESLGHLQRLLDPSRLLAATESGTIVGSAASLAFQLSVPGGEVGAAGVTLVGVRPSHRRRGILRQLMRRQLADLHARGEPVAILWASEAGIYQRFGYGLGTLRASIDLARGWSAFLDPAPPAGELRLVDVGEASRLLPPVYERARVGIPGALRRTPYWWESRRLADPEWARQGGGPMFRAVLEIDGVPEGYALYRFHGSWDDHGLPARWLEVIEALGTSPAATRAVWQFLFGIDIVGSVRTTRLCADHPLFWMLADPRRLRTRLFDGIWLRVVDVPAALGRRCYGAEAALTFELTDELCPWNAGVWQLEAGPDGAAVTRSDRAPELRLGVAELGALYLGAVSCRSLQGAGRVAELAPGAARRADALFQADAPAWCLDDF